MSYLNLTETQIKEQVRTLAKTTLGLSTLRPQGVLTGLIECMASLTAYIYTTFLFPLKTQLTRATAKTEAINAAIPLGFIYVQYPNQNTPAQLGWPGTWKNISANYKDAFFRAEGSNQTDATKAGAQPFANQTAPQADAGRNATGHLESINIGNSVEGIVYNGTTRSLSGYGGSGTYHYKKREIDLSRAWGATHTSDEFKVTNYTIIVWKRES